MKYYLIFITCLINTISFGQVSPGLQESDFYHIADVPIPSDVLLEVGGLAFDDRGRLGVCTRRGEVWTITNPETPEPLFKRIAHGLHEPLGLAWNNGSFLSNQRAELTRLIDTDHDNIVDYYQEIATWELAGNYHEYSYGPLILPSDEMIVTLNLGWEGRGVSLAKWGGWMLKVSEDGQVSPFATGMRSPAGFGLNAEGDIFYTDNQGDWVGSGRMTHLEKGDFAGHPEGLKWSQEPGSPIDLQMDIIDDSKGLTLYEYARDLPALKPPSVWFPHTIMGVSTSDISLIPDGFGLFRDQLLVGDQGHSKIMRVYQEKINGVYQGICFPFREGFASGVFRMTWGPDHSLYVGMTSRGWSSTGKASYGLQRLTNTGKTPFEMERVNIETDGFSITFTKPVDRMIGSDPASYQLTDFTYKYHHNYGSPAIHREDRTVYKVALSQDGMKARLFVEGIRAGYICELKLPKLRSAEGGLLLHPTGYYTINEIPGGKPHVHTESGDKTMYQKISIRSPKRITTMPKTWSEGPDRTVTIGTLPGMQFDLKEVTIKSGERIKWVLNNPDDMMHNLVITKPGAIDEVAKLAMELGLKGHEKGYVPDSELVLHHTNLLVPHESDVIYFVAPETPGTYHYVCTFPGHALIMNGILNVIPTGGKQPF